MTRLRGFFRRLYLRLFVPIGSARGTEKVIR